MQLKNDKYTVKASCTFFEIQRDNLSKKEVKTLLHRLKTVKNEYCKKEINYNYLTNKFKYKRKELEYTKANNPLKIEIIKNG